MSLAKYLFGQARHILVQGGPYSRGLATSVLHDSVEIFLRVLAEHYRIDLPRRESFLQLFDSVRNRLRSVGEHSAGIRRLNTARVAFKHEGLDCSSNEVGAFAINVEALFSEVCNQELGLDFATLSRIDAIPHRRTRNWLERARESLLSERYTDSIAQSAAALAIYLRHRDLHRNEPNDPGYYIGSDSSELQRMADFVLDYVEPIRARLDLLSHGIDVVSQEKFEAITPSTHVDHHGTLRQSNNPASARTTDSLREDARFCYDFAVDSALALRGAGVPPATPPKSEAERVPVTARCELIVHPDANPQEVIRVAEMGEELLICPSYRRVISPRLQSEFLPIIQDGDTAYVRKDCLDMPI